MDPSLEAGGVVEVVVQVPEGDGASAALPTVPDDAPRPGGLPLVDDDGRPVFLPPVEPRPGRTLLDLIGLAPSSRTAEEIDREIRDFRGDEDDL